MAINVLFRFFQTIYRQLCCCPDGLQLPVPWYAKIPASTRHFSTRAVPVLSRAVPVPRCQPTTPTSLVSRRTVQPTTVRILSPTNWPVPTAMPTRLILWTSDSTLLRTGSEVTPLDVTMVTWPYRGIRERSGCRSERRPEPGLLREAEASSTHKAWCINASW